MSAFLPDSFKEQETKQTRTPEQGPEAYLSPEERKFWKRFTSFPEELHPDFIASMIEYMKVNLPSEIRVDQFQGFRQFTASSSVIETAQTTASSTYVNLATDGPVLTGIADGQYSITYGATVTNSGAFDSVVSPSINGATPTDAEAVGTGAGVLAGVSRAILKTLSGGGNNTIRLQYRVTGGTGTFSKRFLIVQRVGN